MACHFSCAAMDIENQQRSQIPRAAAMLLAIIPATSLMAVAMYGERLPYVFFSLTRFAVAATCFWLAWWLANMALAKKISTLIPVHIAIGIFYQPFLRIHLTRELWWWANLATIGVLLLTVVVVWRVHGRQLN
jgi:hypothetical protein